MAKEITVTTNDSNVSMDAASKAYDRFFTELTKLDENNIICRPNCKFCNHEKRFQAEEVWDQYRSLTKVKAFFDTYTTEDPDNRPVMSIMNVKLHVYHHYAEQQKRIRLQEYTQKLPELIKTQMAQDHFFDLLIVTIQEKYLDIISNEAIDIGRQIDAMLKLGSMAVKIMELQSRLKGEIKTINMMAEKFVTVWINLIESEKDPLLKRKIADGLDVFKEQIGDIALQIG